MKIHFSLLAIFQINQSVTSFSIDQVIAETNQGYANSEMPITVTKFCSELSTVSDPVTDRDSDQLLTNFRRSKGSTEALRNTADVAVLFVTYFPGKCGRQGSIFFKMWI